MTRNEELQQSEFDDEEWTCCGSVEEATKLLLRPSDLPVKKLNLRESNLDDDDVIALAPCLAGNANLQQIQLSCNNIGSNGAVAIFEACLYHPSIQCLWLADNRIGVEGAKAIAQMLEEKSDGKTGTSAEEQKCQGRQSLKEGFLERIDLCRNMLGNAGCEVLLKALTRFDHVRIRRLGLALNNLGSSDEENKQDGALAALGNIISKCSHLEGLILDGNPLGDAGAEALARSIVENPQVGLKKLYVRKVGFSEDGIQMLMDAASSTKTNDVGGDDSPRTKIYFQ